MSNQDKKNSIKSTLSQHTVKKGLAQIPLNAIPNLNPTSWHEDRLPEYIWLGLILMNFKNRKEGIESIGLIFKAISKKVNYLVKPKLSNIFSLTHEEQETIYKIIIDKIDYRILSPLTVIYRTEEYNLFNAYFYEESISVTERIQTLSKAIKLYYDHQSHESTDLRYCISSLSIFQGKMHFSESQKDMTEMLIEYPYLEHKDEKMRSIRPFIRTLEMQEMPGTSNEKFANNFWKEISMKKECNPSWIKYEENDQVDNTMFIKNFQYILKYIKIKDKESSIFDHKYDVLIGSSVYLLKIFNDIVTNKLTNSILARNAFRTIIEVYIMMKYLLKVENEHLNIWEEYKVYGIGKYKLPLLKERDGIVSGTSHFYTPIIEFLVNEMKLEEFVDIDLRYFDKKNIKGKSVEVDESDLYNLSYEYDTNFVHGFWGAVRESSILQCEEVSHQYHLIPDFDLELNLPDISSDILEVLKKLQDIICDLYKVPSDILDN